MANEHKPPMWSYNPSAWSQRLPIIALATVGVFIAGYLASFQLELVDSVWDPFFGQGTEKVLASDMSHTLSKYMLMPDALLGMFAYLLDVVTGAIGGRERWRTMPWIVIVFGFAVGPLGVVSIGLVMSQPIIVGHWCTLCLASAFVSLLMIGPALDELLASLQYVKHEMVQGRSGWRAFWGLDREAGVGPETPELEPTG